jgi:hypothetical protein
MAGLAASQARQRRAPSSLPAHASHSAHATDLYVCAFSLMRHIHSVCSFDGNEYVLKETSACTLQEWLQRVVAIVVQVGLLLPSTVCVSLCFYAKQEQKQNASSSKFCSQTRLAPQGNTWQFKDFHSKDPTQVTQSRATRNVWPLLSQPS